MSDVNALEKQLADNKKLIELKNAALRLERNADFRKIILDGFCEEDAARSIRLSIEPQLSERDRADCVAAAQAAGYLKRHLSGIIRMGQNAEGGMDELEETIEQARQEADAIAANPGDSNDHE